MQTLSKELINEIRQSVDIVDIVSKYIPLTKKGKNYFGVCPFHDDSDPSLSVSQEKQIFSCFSCHTSGNVFNFIMEYEHISFIEAVKMIADTSNIKLDIKVANNNIIKPYLYDIYDTSLKFYTNNINTNIGIKAKEYLNKRNITDELIKEFQIGLAIKDTTKLSNILLKNYKGEQLVESTLIVKDEKGYHDFFYNRIMFPLTDYNNKVIGYSGRLYDSEGPKYVNSKEHPLFKKGEFIYNYYRAKDDCRSKNTVIIMEGFMDIIRAYSIGVKNVVATMGTAFTKKHANIIKRLASNVIICYDGDNAGNKATLACSNELISMSIIPKIVRLENNLDPDEYILKYGKEKFIEKLEHPISVMDFKLEYYNQDTNGTEQKANYAKKILEELSNIDDDILREITIKKLSKITDLEEEYLKSKLNKKEIVKITKKQIKYSKYELAQLNLLFYMLKYPEVIEMYDNQVFYFPTREYRLLAQELKCFYKKNNYIDISEIMDDLNDELKNTVSIVESLNLKDDYKIETINDYIKAIKEINIESECDKLDRKINETNDEDEQALLAQKMLDLIIRREKDV